MTTRLIEECSGLENIEDKEHNRWIRILIPMDTISVVVDPFIINIRDLENVKPGRVALIRVRRPGWGRVDIRKHIYILR